MIFERPSKVLSILSCLLLGGCTGSTYSSHFDCPYGTGAGCSSLSKVNKMIDRQEINLDDDTSITNCSEGNGGTCMSKKKQIYIYYGPDQMSKIISIDEPHGDVSQREVPQRDESQGDASPVGQEGDKA